MNEILAYSCGERIWFPIEYKDFLLAVQCTIIRVDDQFRKKHPAGIIFYDLDEPIGHSIVAGTLFGTLDELKECYSDEYAVDSDHSPSLLEDWRVGTIEFIRKTHGGDVSVAEICVACQLREKREGEDWFVFRKIPPRSK